MRLQALNLAFNLLGARSQKMANKDSHNKQLREHLIDLLKGGGAHVTFEDSVKNLPDKLRGVKPSPLPHSPWMLLEHLRIAIGHSGIQPQREI
jgi:hypothetical protein